MDIFEEPKSIQIDEELAKKVFSVIEKGEGGKISIDDNKFIYMSQSLQILDEKFAFNEIEVSFDFTINTNVNSELKIFDDNLKKYVRKVYMFKEVNFFYNSKDSKFVDDPNKANKILTLPSASIRVDNEQSLTIKTNFYVKKIKIKDSTMKLKYSLESEKYEISPELNVRALKKTKNIVCWFLMFSFEERKHIIRIAFDKNSNIFNVENEENIDLFVFAHLKKALKTYYNYQYTTQNGLIFPITKNFKAFKTSIDYNELSEEKKQILNSLQLCEQPKENNLQTNYINFFNHIVYDYYKNFVFENVIKEHAYNKLKESEKIPEDEYIEDSIDVFNKPEDSSSTKDKMDSDQVLKEIFSEFDDNPTILEETKNVEEEFAENNFEEKMYISLENINEF